MRTFLALIDLTSLDPLALVSGECAIAHLARFDTRVTATTCGVGSLCLLNGGVGAARWLAVSGKERIAAIEPAAKPAEVDAGVEAALEPVAPAVAEPPAQASQAARRDRIVADHWKTFFVLVWLTYPALSLLQFKGLKCQEFDEGKVRLLQVSRRGGSMNSISQPLLQQTHHTNHT